MILKNEKAMDMNLQLINDKKKKKDLFFIENILSLIKKGERFYQTKPPGSGDAWIIAELARKRGNLAPLAVFVSDPLDVQRLYNELAIFAPELCIRNFPDWETLPYDDFSPHKDLISERLSTLYRLIFKEIDILLISINTALQRLIPTNFLNDYTFYFRTGDTIDLRTFRDKLTRISYSQVTRVSNPGEYCFRGGLIDLFPIGVTHPYRIDLIDNEIDSIHTFNVNTQRSLNEVGKIRLLPSSEFPMDEESRSLFQKRFQEETNTDPLNSKVCQDVSNGTYFGGIEYYLPLFFENTATIFDYLQSESVCITIGNIDRLVQNYLKNTVLERFSFLKKDHERKILAPKKLFLDNEELFSHFRRFARLAFSDKKKCSYFSNLPDLSILQKNEDPLLNLKNILKNRKIRLLLFTESIGRLKILAGMFNKHGLEPDLDFFSFDEFYNSNSNFAILVGPLDKGFYFHKDSLLLFTENDLYPLNRKIITNAKNLRKSEDTFDSMLRDLTELCIGDLVVHKRHGIGRYCGLKDIEDLENGQQEFLCLEYLDSAMLYVPVAKLHLVSRYSGSKSESAPIHKLGSEHWGKIYKKAKQQIRDIAAELLKLYAERSCRKGYKFLIPENEYIQFSNRFGFEETPDQSEAIKSVISDMKSQKPMDRLICGDVGFGKTEIALRAAFIAASNGKQVVLLCPTTLLAEQHTQTFLDRFSDYPIRISEISRFRNRKEINETLFGIRNGSIDIVIGTHKILSSKVEFKNLGLVIIDEEHRFGVHQKEKLRNSICLETDVLTLTATPIPRTLSMSLEGMRDLSIIATAPQERLSVKVFVRSETRSIIKEALLREFRRGGQAYFVHNEIETIYERKSYLEEIIPESRIAVAHGQMKERDLEGIMKGFYQKRYNLLLCTTIIETGIDIPNANTILIHRADLFGLAQLHQLRGRVGRSHHQAYAYLMIPDEEMMKKNAKKRLDVIQFMNQLGSGFQIAIHDLEIRGTGDLLGHSQSGNIQQMGFALYNEMLNEAVSLLKDNNTKPNEFMENFSNPFTCEVNLHESALIPSCYCSDVPSRISIYKQLSLAKNEEHLNEIEEGLIDRFGQLPKPVKVLFSSHKIRILAEVVRIKKIDASEHRLLLYFAKNTLINPKRIIYLIQKNPFLKMQEQNTLRIDKKTLSVEERIQEILDILQLIKIKN